MEFLSLWEWKSGEVDCFKEGEKGREGELVTFLELEGVLEKPERREEKKVRKKRARVLE